MFTSPLHRFTQLLCLLFWLFLATATPLYAAGGGGSSGGGAGSWVEGKLNYYPLPKPLTVNLIESEEISFAQVELTLLTREVATIQAIEANQPAITDTLLMILSAQKRETLSSIEGKTQVQSLMLEAIRKVLAELAGSGSAHGTPPAHGDAHEAKGVEKVLITNFIFQ